MTVKQNAFQKNSSIGSALALPLALCALCTSPVPGFSQGVSTTFDKAVAKVRLIADRQKTKGAYQAGIAMTMPSGSHTYWKRPGEAGVPPVFAFNGSSNVAKAEVLFPVPSRITEDGLDAFGYSDHVVFPVVVTPTDAERPSTLHLDMSYAVCNKICMPGHATADLTMPVKAANADEPAIAAAFSAVPAPLPAADMGKLTLTPVAGAAKPSWTVAWTGKTSLKDIFADAPEGYAFDTKKGATSETWILTATQAVVSAGGAVPVSLTLAGGHRSFVETQTLNVSGAKP